jgi:hypothetical protein
MAIITILKFLKFKQTQTRRQALSFRPLGTCSLNLKKECLKDSIFWNQEFKACRTVAPHQKIEAIKIKNFNIQIKKPVMRIIALRSRDNNLAT